MLRHYPCAGMLAESHITRCTAQQRWRVWLLVLPAASPLMEHSSSPKCKQSY